MPVELTQQEHAIVCRWVRRYPLEHQICAPRSEEPTFEVRCGDPPVPIDTLVRASSTTCRVVRVSGDSSLAPVSINGWEFTPAVHDSYFELGNVPGTGTTWGGVIVASGEVTATVSLGGGNAVELSGSIVVTPRNLDAFSGSALYTDPTDIRDILNLPAILLPEGADTLLGVTRPFYDPTQAWTPISDGPNHGYLYAKSVPFSDRPIIGINCDQMSLGSVLHSNHAGLYPGSPPGGGDAYCSPDYVIDDLVTLTETHEGTTTQTGSHTFYHSSWLTTVGSAGVAQRGEAVVAGNGVTDPIANYVMQPDVMSQYSVTLTHMQPWMFPNCSLVWDIVEVSPPGGAR